MDMVNIHSLRTSAGFMPDLPPEDVPPGAFNGGYNYSVGSRGIEKTTAFGDSRYISVNSPHAVFYQPIGASESYIIVAGDTTVEYFSDLAIVNITREASDYSADAVDAPWSMTDMNGLLCLNNQNDVLQYLAADEKLQDLPNLPANTQFKRIVSYKNFLIGLGVSEDDGLTWNPHRLMWSAPADPGAVPPDWDIGGTTSKAGDNILSTRLPIRDAKVLGETLFIYKGDSIYAVEFSGGSYVFTFKKRFSQFGILAPNCVAEFDNKHFVVTEEDFRTHDGFKSDPIGTDTIRDYFFDNIDKQYFGRTFVASDIANSQIWICFPTQGNSVPNKAILWNWKRDKWGIKNLPKNFTAGAYAERGPAIDYTYDSIKGSYDRQGNYLGLSFRALEAQLGFIADGYDKVISASDDGLEFEEPQETLLERTCIPLGPLTRDGVIIPDFTSYKVMGEMWFYVDTDSPFEVQLGAQHTLSSDVEWGEWMTFDPAKQRKLDMIFSAVYLAMRVKTSAAKFSLNRIEFRFGLEGELYGLG